MQMFIERLRRTNRHKEFTDKARTYMLGGMSYGDARQKAAKECGFAGRQLEKNLYNEWLRECQRGKMVEQVAPLQAEIREELEVQSFEKCLASLPHNAPDRIELNWIAAHPAMTRHDRASDKTKNIKIEAVDLLFAPHGKCPSQAAAIALQHWVNRPGEFHKQIISERKKQAETDAAKADAEKDLGLAEIERILKEFDREYQRSREAEARAKLARDHRERE